MKKTTYIIILFTCFYACQKQVPPVAVQMDAYYQKAESFLDRQNDSAFYYYNKSAGNSKDSLQVAISYNRMASLQSEAGDHFGSQETLSMSLKFLNENDPHDHSCLASDYNELGTNSIKLKNFKEAIGYYSQAIQFTDHQESLATLYNNQGTAYQETKDYGRALTNYRIAFSKTEPGSLTYARILNNEAQARWLKNPNYKAAAKLLTALHIRQALNDRWGENSSYDHLVNYYMNLKPDSALYYAQKVYTCALRLNSPDDRLEALRKLVLLVPAERVKSYFSKYQELNDSLRIARGAARNQFALIRYDAEKSKADNLKLKEDNTEKKYQLDKQRILLYGAALVLIIAIFWYRKRKERMLLEARSAIRDSELKISKRVHDVVANGLYRVMKQVQYQEIDKEVLVDKIDALYQRSRDISYDRPKSSQDFQASVAELLQSFASESTRVLLVGNEAELWNGSSDLTRNEVEHILQELMVNMSKHSQAINVVIKFSRAKNRVDIIYTDDGVGMPDQVRYGNGLTSTGNRIQAISGGITFEPNGARGLRIDLSFPIV